MLPTDDAARKALPIWDGVVMYFPKALAAIAAVSKAGNDQHHPGEPLHWARGKSMDQFNTQMRHAMDHCMGARYDSDGQRHLAKAAWRALAALELDIEAEQTCQAATTPNTSKPTRKPPSKSRNGKLETRPDTTLSVKEKSTKGTASTSTTDDLLRRVAETNRLIGESDQYTPTAQKGI